MGGGGSLASYPSSKVQSVYTWRHRVQWRPKNALYLSVKVFSTKVLIGDTIFTPPTAERMKWRSIRWCSNNHSCGSSITFFLWKEFLLFEGLGLFLWLQRHQCVGFYRLTSTMLMTAVGHEWQPTGSLTEPRWRKRRSLKPHTLLFVRYKAILTSW